MVNELVSACAKNIIAVVYFVRQRSIRALKVHSHFEALEHLREAHIHHFFFIVVFSMPFCLIILYI